MWNTTNLPPKCTQVIEANVLFIFCSSTVITYFVDLEIRCWNTMGHGAATKINLVKRRCNHSAFCNYDTPFGAMLTTCQVALKWILLTHPSVPETMILLQPDRWNLAITSWANGPQCVAWRYLHILHVTGGLAFKCLSKGKKSTHTTGHLRKLLGFDFSCMLAFLAHSHLAALDWDVHTREFVNVVFGQIWSFGRIHQWQINHYFFADYCRLCFAVTCMQSKFPTYYIIDSWVPFVHFCAWPLAQFHSCFILEVFPHSCKWRCWNWHMMVGPLASLMVTLIGMVLMILTWWFCFDGDAVIPMVMVVVVFVCGFWFVVCGVWRWCDGGGEDDVDDVDVDYLQSRIMDDVGDDDDCVDDYHDNVGRGSGRSGFVCFFLASLVPFRSLCAEFGSKLWLCLVCKFFLIPWKYFFGS